MTSTVRVRVSWLTRKVTWLATKVVATRTQSSRKAAGDMRQRTAGWG